MIPESSMARARCTPAQRALAGSCDFQVAERVSKKGPSVSRGFQRESVYYQTETLGAVFAASSVISPTRGDEDLQLNGGEFVFSAAHDG